MILNYTTLIKQLDNQRLDPVYFFHGPEDLLIERALEKIKVVVLNSGAFDFNWNVFRAGDGEVDWSAFADTLVSLPLIPSQRIVILKDLARAIRTKTVQKLIDSILKSPPEDLTFIMIENDPDFIKKSFGEKLQKSHDSITVVAFNRLNSEELEQQLIGYAGSFGKQISPEAMERILSETDPSLRELLSKIEVLILYVGEKSVIEVSDVEASLVFTREVEIFSLLRALGKKDQTETRKSLQYLLQGRTEIGALIHLLYRQTWALYRMKYLQEQKVSSASWQQQLNIRPAFLERRYREYLPHFTRSELGRSLEALAKADLSRKTQSPPDDLLLNTLTESLLQP
ncbi:MAG: DNA polymerase III subunit delta [bacterium]|nr:DNA polymerase III subunit delta [bacterium]